MEATEVKPQIVSDSYMRTLKRTLALLDWVVSEEEGRIQAHPNPDYPDVNVTFSPDANTPSSVHISIWDAMDGREVVHTTCTDPDVFRAIPLVQQLLEAYWRLIQLS